jgi:hypothetical protein
MEGDPGFVDAHTPPHRGVLFDCFLSLDYFTAYYTLLLPQTASLSNCFTFQLLHCPPTFCSHLMFG